MALDRDIFSPASLAFPTSRQDDDCVRPVLIDYTCRSSAFLQSAVERFRLLMLLHGTTCQLLSHLRRRSRFSDSASIDYISVFALLS